MEEIIGQWWDRFITASARRDYPHAAVALTEMEQHAGVLFRALGGDGGLRIAAAGASRHGARRTWRERLAGIGERVELAWRDDQALYLPERLAVFADRTHNHELYLWLAALASVESGDEGAGWFVTSQRAVCTVLKRYPGLHARYRRLVQAQLAVRPDLGRLPRDAALQEQAVCAALQRPGSVATLPAARHPPAPVWLWLHPNPPRTTGSERTATDDTSATAKRARPHRDRRRRQATRVSNPDGRDGLLLYRFEGIFGIGEFVNVNRGVEDSDPGQHGADDFDELAIARDAAPVASRVRFDLDLPAAGQDDVPLGPGLLVPEWDYRRRQMRPDYCRIEPLVAARAAPCALPDALRAPARRLRRQFEALLPADHWRGGQPDGVEPDLDAWLRHTAERAAGTLTASPDLYRCRERGRRDLACLLLADLSLSTDTWVGNDRRVIDVIRDSLFLFSEALHATGDRFALYGFSSRRREHVRFHHLKGFGEAYSARVRGRILAIRPGFYTRMGAAIRQATTLLSREPASQRLLLVLTDGKPNDLDQYEGRYGVEDTRQAIQAARRAGLTPFCVTIDDEGADYLPHLFGAGGYVRIHRPEQLPRQLPMLYARLTPVR